MKRFYGLLVLFSTIGSFAAPPVQHLTVEGVRPARMKVGQAAEVVVEVKVREGFHIQANPASRPQLIATRVDLSGGKGLSPGRALYPEGKPYKVGGLAMTVSTYDGHFELKVPVKASDLATPGKQDLAGRIRYQACDDKVCFPPTVAKFTAPVEVLP